MQVAGHIEQTSATDPVVRTAQAVCALIFGPPGARPFAIRYWNGELEPAAAGEAPCTIVIRRAGGLRRMLLPPSELSIVEAVLSGDVELEGDLEQVAGTAEAVHDRLASPRVLLELARLLRRLPADDAVEVARQARAAHTVQREGVAHDPERDQKAIRYHYDVGNDFYALWLDPRMVYSCAVYEDAADPEGGLEAAQVRKLDLVCRKLGLQAGHRLLDVGCGWGALIMHAAAQYGVDATGITLSEAQASLARERIAAAGLSDRCRVEIRDYRALAGLDPFDRISSIGMVEHVGLARLPEYFASLRGALRPGGLLLNHGIVSVNEARPRSRWDWLERRIWKRDAFIDQYVFPDARLTALSSVIATGEGAGFEVRDVESLREHYALTLRAWLARLEAHRDEAIRATDERTYRTWRLYMAASAYGFAHGNINIVQTLFSLPHADGRAEVPMRRMI